MKPKLFILLPLLSLMFCGGPQQAVRSDREEDQLPPSKQYDESVPATVFGEYTVQIKSDAKKQADIVDIEEILKGETTQDTSVSNREIPGYRVQIISTREVEVARAVFREAVISFDENVYRTYDNPYYKVRVGDFVSRFDANALQENAVELGFLEAWVVRSVVNEHPEVVRTNNP